jgi:hypothetical protein
MATIKEEQIRALPGWQARGDGVSRTFRFDDFGVATRFVGRIALDAAVACREPLIGIRGLLGDHRHPVGRAGPWSPHGPLTSIRPRPVGQASP